MSNLRWVLTDTSLDSGRRRQPDYGDDFGFTPAMWTERSTGRADHQWRSYSLDGGPVVARMSLSPTYTSHDGASLALLIGAIEVHADARLAGIGTAIVSDLLYEYPTQEIYAGPTPASAKFWDKKLIWPRCDCSRCKGRDFVVSRP